MKHLLDEMQTKEFLFSIRSSYEEFKFNNGWHLTEQMEDNYKEGIIDALDAISSANQQLTFDLYSIRNAVEELFEEMDKEEDEL